DKGRQGCEQRLSGGNVPGTGPPLDQRGAFPILSTTLVVIERRGGGDGDLGRGRIGTQPQIGAENVTVGGTLLQQLNQCPRQPHVKGRGLRCRRNRRGDVKDGGREHERYGCHREP